MEAPGCCGAPESGGPRSFLELGSAWETGTGFMPDGHCSPGQPHARFSPISSALFEMLCTYIHWSADRGLLCSANQTAICWSFLLTEGPLVADTRVSSYLSQLTAPGTRRSVGWLGSVAGRVRKHAPRLSVVGDRKARLCKARDYAKRALHKRAYGKLSISALFSRLTWVTDLSLRPNTGRSVSLGQRPQQIFQRTLDRSRRLQTLKPGREDGQCRAGVTGFGETPGQGLYRTH